MGHARALLGLDGADAIRQGWRRGPSASSSRCEPWRRWCGAHGKPAGKGKKPEETASTRDLVQPAAAPARRPLPGGPKSAASGRLEIDYTSLEELDGILARIGA